MTGEPAREWCLHTRVIDAPDGTLDDVEVLPNLADVDGDDLPELWTVVSTDGSSALTQYFVESNGLAITGESLMLEGRVQFADINGDGRDDVLRSYDGDAPWEWIDLSMGTPSAPQEIGEPAYAEAWTDIDADGDADVIKRGPSGVWLELWLNDGTGTLTPGAQLTGDFEEFIWVQRVFPVGPGVFAAEPTNDAIDYGHLFAAWEVLYEDGTLRIGAHTPVIEEALHIAVDFDLDGRLDFITSGAEATIWRGSETGASGRTLSDLDWIDVGVVGDFIGLGAPALLLADSERSEVHTTPLDSSALPLPVLGGIGQLLHVVDFDGDGKDQLIDGWQDDDGSVRYRLLDVRPCG